MNHSVSCAFLFVFLWEDNKITNTLKFLSFVPRFKSWLVSYSLSPSPVITLFTSFHLFLAPMTWTFQKSLVTVGGIWETWPVSKSDKPGIFCVEKFSHLSMSHWPLTRIKLKFLHSLKHLLHLAWMGEQNQIWDFVWQSYVLRNPMTERQVNWIFADPDLAPDFVLFEM